MELFKYIILAIVQGIAEILPISSSGHLYIFQNILQVEGDGFLSLAIFLHFGSLVAVVIYYFKDIINLIVGTWKFLFFKEKSEDDKFQATLLLWMVIATVPAGIVGFFVSDYIDSVLGSLWFVFSFLIFTGLVLFFIKYIKTSKSIKDMKWYDALYIGMFQAIGVLPGVSRSGITIAASKTRGFDDEGSAKFAFLLFLPVTLGSFLLELLNVVSGDTTLSDPVYYYVIGVVVAGIATFVSLKLLFGIIKRGKLHYFAYYCLALGVIGLIVGVVGVSTGAFFY